ncbi:hypothetical protein [Shewanella waksmanii]|uniref:hypothetical protein n=1 Tax=Shewanella waksmanii TaxID=213783 RepID=UPI0037363FEA
MPFIRYLVSKALNSRRAITSLCRLVLNQHLLGLGYDAELKQGKLTVKLPGFSHRITIEYDIAHARYDVNTHDFGHVISYTLLFILALNGLITSSMGFLSVFTMGGSLAGYVTVILTELKVKHLRQVIQAVNDTHKATI